MEAQMSPVDRFMQDQIHEDLRESMRKRINLLPRLWGYQIATKDCRHCASESRNLLATTLELCKTWAQNWGEYANQWELINKQLL